MAWTGTASTGVNRRTNRPIATKAGVRCWDATAVNRSRIFRGALRSARHGGPCFVCNTPIGSSLREHGPTQEGPVTTRDPPVAPSFGGTRQRATSVRLQGRGAVAYVLGLDGTGPAAAALNRRERSRRLYDGARAACSASTRVKAVDVRTGGDGQGSALHRASRASVDVAADRCANAANVELEIFHGEFLRMVGG